MLSALYNRPNSILEKQRRIQNDHRQLWYRLPRSGLYMGTFYATFTVGMAESIRLDDYSVHAMSQNNGACEPPDPANTITDRLNTLLNSSGPGFVLQLCPSKQYLIQAPIRFAAPDQEISTTGYPLGEERATLVVNGLVEGGTGHTTAVDGTCPTCSGVRLRNIQIDGTRRGASPTQGGGNIEMGGSNSNQLIEYVRSYDPRSWSCLHIAEGALDCANATVQHNDIGPCGSDNFQEWADGISMSCRNSLVRNNTIIDATDGGIVVFGSPGTVIEENVIRIDNQTLLGGINMVDYDPFSGDYTSTIVRNNLISGGFAHDSPDDGASKGTNLEDAIIKIGLAIGPRTWFGERYAANVSHSGTVTGNRFTGAFSYAIAVTSARNFTVQDNILIGNTSFIGKQGPNCSTTDTVPDPAPFVLDLNNTQESNLQSDFKSISDGDSLTCVLPPDGGDYWPFGGNPAEHGTTSRRGLSGGAIVGVVLATVVAFALLLFFGRKYWLKRRLRRSW
ncbi:hypothetical protein HGRIS_010110 [Hohenbuehelia grisea]|uniref:Right handed beta helix domain-containing protein n=1 Tax=Hohenbuehelia grisea TaxID=104357 RepID=A0ABR3J3P0_9AGAR